MTSEKMNQPMLQRNDMSTFVLYRRSSDSPITVPNHPNSIVSSTANPARTSHGPAATALNHRAAPSPSRNSAHEPTSGQYEGCGTK